jgi:PPK2 family polyphosphate:nucleotide phosphotransferase
MKIRSKDYLVRPGTTVKLRKYPTWVKPPYKSEDRYKEILNEYVQRLSALQSLLYAHDRYALLLIFQALDAAGKDGAIKHVMSGVNPQGCQVFNFREPSGTELQHDFLWRAVKVLPERGHIGIFNRSYYEEVLVVRVHPQILAGQRLPAELLEEKRLWSDRYRSIVNLEDHLHRNGTRVVKFYLHVSKDEQRRRFLERIDQPEKNWKVSLGDIRERESWGEYMKAFEKCLSATSSRQAPWYIVPADHKEHARLIISKIILDTLESLSMSYPKSTPERLRELRAMRGKLAK